MEIGQTYFGKYKIIRELGAGGFGRVYLAKEKFGGRQVAIKTLRWEISEEDKQEARDRFEREIRIGLELEHPHILRAHTYEPDDEICLVMDYMPDGSLADWLRKFLDEDRRPDPETVLRYVRQICEALDYLHHFRRRCYVHRDVTPNNILLDENDRARLMDFGLIQEPGSSTLMDSWGKTASHPGTPLYQSPEARAGEPVLLAASDVYMLGAVLFELLTGYPYFHKQDVPPSKLEPGLSSDLDDVVMKAVAEDPRERYRSAADFERALAVVAEQLAAQRRAHLQGYADQIEGALEAGRWAEALAVCDTLAELDSAYPELNKWREQAQAGQQAEAQATARERTRHARLAELYKAIQAARQAGDWQAVIDRCDRLLDLEPDYRDVAQMKAEAEAELARKKSIPKPISDPDTPPKPIFGKLPEAKSTGPINKSGPSREMFTVMVVVLVIFGGGALIMFGGNALVEDIRTITPTAVSITTPTLVREGENVTSKTPVFLTPTTESEIESDWMAEVAEGPTGLRARANSGSRPIRVMNAGDRLDLLLVTDDRAWVQAKDLQSNKIGWIIVDRLTLNVSLDELLEVKRSLYD